MYRYLTQVCKVSYIRCTGMYPLSMCPTNVIELNHTSHFTLHTLLFTLHTSLFPFEYLDGIAKMLPYIALILHIASAHSICT